MSLCVVCACFFQAMSLCVVCACFFQAYWSDSGELVCLATDESFYILRYNQEAVQGALSTNQGMDEDGIEAAFDVRREGGSGGGKQRKREGRRGRGKRRRIGRGRGKRRRTGRGREGGDGGGEGQKDREQEEELGR